MFDTIQLCGVAKTVQKHTREIHAKIIIFARLCNFMINYKKKMIVWKQNDEKDAE